MEFESINQSQIRVTLSHSDLAEQNVTVNDIKRTPLVLQQFFGSVVAQAEEELDFNAEGPISVELYVSNLGVDLIITKVDADSMDDEDFNEEEGCPHCGGAICGRTPKAKEPEPLETGHIIYWFGDFELVIQVANRLHHHDIASGSVHHYKNVYYFAVPESKLGDVTPENVHAIMSEFGQKSKTTIHMLEEYGKPIFEENAVRSISRKFCQ